MGRKIIFYNWPFLSISLYGNTSNLFPIFFLYRHFRHFLWFLFVVLSGYGFRVCHRDQSTLQDISLVFLIDYFLYFVSYWRSIFFTVSLLFIQYSFLVATVTLFSFSTCDCMYFFISSRLQAFFQICFYLLGPACLNVDQVDFVCRLSPHWYRYNPLLWMSWWWGSWSIGLIFISWACIIITWCDWRKTALSKCFYNQFTHRKIVYFQQPYFYLFFDWSSVVPFNYIISNNNAIISWYFLFTSLIKLFSSDKQKITLETFLQVWYQ